LRGKLAHDDFEERVKRKNFVTEFVLAFFIDLGEIKRIDFGLSVKRKINVLTADGFAERLVFAFWVNDDDFSAKHEGAKSFKLDEIGLASAGFSKDDRVGVFKTEAVEDN